jgi:hypothetical protein
MEQSVGLSGVLKRLVTAPSAIPLAQRRQIVDALLARFEPGPSCLSWFQTLEELMLQDCEVGSPVVGTELVNQIRLDALVMLLAEVPQFYLELPPGFAMSQSQQNLVILPNGSLGVWVVTWDGPKRQAANYRYCYVPVVGSDLDRLLAANDDLMSDIARALLRLRTPVSAS